jgi:hypothetical protein
LIYLQASFELDSVAEAQCLKRLCQSYGCRVQIFENENKDKLNAIVTSDSAKVIDFIKKNVNNLRENISQIKLNFES